MIVLDVHVRPGELGFSAAHLHYACILESHHLNLKIFHYAQLWALNMLAMFILWLGRLCSSIAVLFFLRNRRENRLISDSAASDLISMALSNNHDVDQMFGEYLAMYWASCSQKVWLNVLLERTKDASQKADVSSSLRHGRDSSSLVQHRLRMHGLYQYCWMISSQQLLRYLGRKFSNTFMSSNVNIEMIPSDKIHFPRTDLWWLVLVSHKEYVASPDWKQMSRIEPFLAPFYHSAGVSLSVNLFFFFWK